MQHVMIQWDPVHRQPCAQPDPGSIYRDDQMMKWFFDANAQNMWWSPDSPGQGIVFREPTSTDPFKPWPGTKPEPQAGPPTTRDRRPYVANGNSPNEGSDPITYAYFMNVQWFDPADPEQTVQQGRVRAFRHVSVGLLVDGKKMVLHSEAIDPEIVNQPQP